MSSSIGNILKITIFGESHNTAIGMVIDGLPAGTYIDNAKIDEALKNRKTNDCLSTSRNELDEVVFLSGVLDNKTTGSPLSFLINNTDVASSSYEKGVIRPSHSDLTEYLKYNGFNDYRGGGFSSGRITASIIVLGAICGEILANHGIKVKSHIKSMHGIEDKKFTDFNNDFKSLESANYPVIDDKARELMIKEIEHARNEKDSIGGEIETVVLNAPIGLGEPYFDSIESYLAKAIFSIGGVKGVSFGDTDLFKNGFASEANDQLRIRDNKIEFLSNHAGGINGGITNGQPILFTTVVKPTPSIGKPQKSINLETKENIDLEIKGRHDPCLLHRVLPVIDALTKFVLVDLMMLKESKYVWLSML